MKNTFRGLLTALTLFACSSPHDTGSSKSTFKILNRIHLPGDGFWDYVTGKILQTLPIGDGADGVAFDPITRQVFSSNGEGTVTIIGEKSADKYQVIATVPSQKGARTIGVNSKTHRIYLPTAEREAAVGNARPAVKPGTFVVLEMGEQ